MKKLLLIAFAGTLALNVYAEGDVDDEEVYQGIITECGTIHQIPSNATLEEIEYYINKYTKEDC